MSISFDVLTLSPVLAPAVAALLVLIVDVVVTRAARLTWLLTMAGAVAGICGVVAVWRRSSATASTLCDAHGGCAWVADRGGMSLQILALAATVVVACLAWLERGPEHERARAAVRAVLVSSATAGCVGVIAARDLGSWLVFIELATIPSIALVALRGGARAAHGALSLLVTALVSFAVQVLGAALWFAATGSAAMSSDVVAAAYGDSTKRPLIIVAMMLILAGVAFKLSLAPFHAWTPESFAGSGSWVSAFLASTSKVGALGGMLVVLRAATSLGASTLVALAIAAALSMTIGNIMALRQNLTLRLMAWSSVAQAGWVVLPMTVVAPGSVSAAGAYVTLYVVGTLAVFVVLAALEDSALREARTAGATSSERTGSLADVRGLFRTHPLLAGTLALGLLALAGLPPSIVGVVAKVVALKPAVTGHVWWLVIVAAVNAVFGVAVYGRWIMVMFSSPSSVDDGSGGYPSLPKSSRGYAVVAALVCLGLIVTSVAPQLLLGAF